MVRRANNHMRLISVLLTFVLAIGYSSLSIKAFAQDNSGMWLEGRGGILQTLDKITARIATLEAIKGVPTRFGRLDITVERCAYRPPDAPPETAAFLVIRDIGYESNNSAGKPIVFSGWMFASSPAISGLEHPVYDVTVLACKK